MSAPSIQSQARQESATEIHASAVVSPRAQIGSNCFVGPYVIIGDDVTLGDRVRIDLGMRTADILVADEELAARRAALVQAGGYRYPESQTPWQEIQRGLVDELSNGMVLKPAVRYQRIAETKGVPRHNH